MEISRRNVLLAAGGTLAAVAIPIPPAAAARGGPGGPHDQACDFALGPGGRKPVFLAAKGSTNPAEHSKNETLFWCDQLTEHGLFLAMLLPGAEATALRRRSLEFRDRFQARFEAVRQATVDATNYRDINRQTIELIGPFVAFKLELEEALRTGKVRGLVYPTFAAHIAAEGEHFRTRLLDLNAGEVQFDLATLVPFWSRIMGEHAHFAAHLLDPGHEQPLIEQARDLAARFEALSTSRDLAEVAAAGEMILDYKETAESGIESGEIQSIIHPVLADHIRREAIKFLDELRRAA